MNVPAIVQSTLEDEQVAATVSLGGEDALYVTPTRTLIYRSDGLLSDESVETYPHDAERIAVSEGRRKSAISLDYGIDGTDEFTVPSKRLRDALHPVLAGVLNAANVTDANEQVIQTYQFSELTLVLTSARVVKHVGEAVWDEDFEQYHFADATRLDVEEGSVSSQILLEVDGRPQRIKTPSDRTREVRERIERALLAYHDVESYAEFEELAAPAEDDAPEADENVSFEDSNPFGGGVDPIDANPPELDDDGQIVETPAEPLATDEDASAGSSEVAAAASPDETTADAGAADLTADASARDPLVGSAGNEASESEADTGTATDAVLETGGKPEDADAPDGRSAAAEAADDQSAAADGATGFADSGFESASANMGDDTAAQLAALAERVERQNELLEKQQRTIERLVEELARNI